MECRGWIAEVKTGGKNYNCLAIILGQVKNESH